ncbi:TetR/AcrR family transcriptional regulator [Pseudomonas sp. PDM31]|uniref:TetR/AcrR family transcriptional regulator n=1 Tax=Pseudomonas sp. PDM31 TaxID=2854778 RepID=UPI001C46E9C8|nr:TetR/AcrR family transcriptional regulator [Pseudomonas sp. PDM31]MBV7477517.1 TetR/AcrR family transcriptional regulator [Pseudomonas sp. PDM31]
MRRASTQASAPLDLTTNPHVPTMEDRTSESSSGTRARHQQIRDTALHLFVTEGYGNVSLRQLAAPLGISAGSLYNHLESKQQLLFELINDHLQNLLNSVESEVRKAADVLEQLRTFIRIHIKTHIQHQSLSLLSNLELRSLDAASRADIKVLLKRYRSCLSNIISKGMHSGAFRSQHLPTAIQTILAMLSSVAFWFDESLQLDTSQLTAQLTAMVMGALCS